MSSGSNHNVGVGELAAYAVFVGYFALIFFSLYCVSRSVVHQIPLSRLAEQKPFLFIRLAIASLLVTWYCELPRCLRASSLADPQICFSL